MKHLPQFPFKAVKQYYLNSKVKEDFILNEKFGIQVECTWNFWNNFISCVVCFCCLFVFLSTFIWILRSNCQFDETSYKINIIISCRILRMAINSSRQCPGPSFEGKSSANMLHTNINECRIQCPGAVQISELEFGSSFFRLALDYSARYSDAVQNILGVREQELCSYHNQ